MIKANKSWWAEMIFRPYLWQLFRRHFTEINLLGIMPEFNPALPTLLLPNHSSWWDGFFVYFLNQRIFKSDIYLMMQETQLRQYPFFTRLGVYSVNAGSPQDLYRSLDYSVKLLEQNSMPRQILCLFPQGELKLWDARPLNYKGGIEWILSQYEERVNLLPLAIKIEQTAYRKPEVFFLFDENCFISTGRFPGIDWLEEMENNLLAELQSRLLRGERGYGLLKIKQKSVASTMGEQQSQTVGAQS